MGHGAPRQDHHQGDRHPGGGGEHQVADGEIGRLGEAQGAVVIPVRVKAVIPDEQVRLEDRDQGEVLPHQVHVLGIGVGMRIQTVGVDIHLGAVVAGEIEAAEAQVKNPGVVPHQLAGAVAVVGVGVHDGKAAPGADFPGVGQGDDHVVKAAGPPELAVARVVAAGADETEGPVDLAFGQIRHAGHHGAHGLVGGGAEAVMGHHVQHLRGVDLEDELLGYPGRLNEAHIGPGQERRQRLGKVPQPVADGHVTLAAERGVVVDADVFHDLAFRRQSEEFPIRLRFARRLRPW